MIWIAGDGLKRLRDGRLVPYRILAANQELKPRALLTDREGGLWIGTQGQGLLRLYQGRIDRFTHADGLSSDIVYCLLEDREGNIWAGTEGGLDRFREYAVTTISRREGLSQSTAGSVFAAKDGAIWIGTTSGLNRMEDGRVTPYGKQSGLPSDNITGIFEEQAGRLWVSTTAGLAYSDGGRFRSLYLPFKLRWFAAAAEDRDHSVWLSVPEHGLVRLRDARLVEVVPWSQFVNKQALALSPPRGRRALAGICAGGIAYYKPGQPVRWDITSGQLSGAAIMDLHRMRDGSLWIATQGGLGRLQNGHLATLTVATGLPCDRVHSMVEDDHGALWLNTGCGLVRISGADLAKWSVNPANKVPVRIYDASDGMRSWLSATGYFRRAAKSTDGRLWFAVFDGVAVVDPNHLPENRLPPPVKIEEITAGHTTYPVNPNLRLPALTKELRIDYTALSFVAPDKVRFRYRLDGFDKDWNDAAGRRQAVYTNLPPKRYTFRVMHAITMGSGTIPALRVPFRLSPPFTRQTGFDFFVCAGSRCCCGACTCFASERWRRYSTFGTRSGLRSGHGSPARYTIPYSRTSAVLRSN